ncbi:hypothetical protein AB6A40_010609 [Gnathostoma spinigerum]|uniref:Uncharacterized protein n=1 Tax=Gnathostoma spinigerum TaxID=75299 RepID=A0ABD6EVB1_9BILA
MKFLLILLIIASVQYCKADWFDDFVNYIHDKLVGGADYLKDEAAPAIREKFNAAKEKLQDPETHRSVIHWIKTEAVPFIKEKYNATSEFVRREVVPEIKKIVNAAEKGAESESSNISEWR